MMIIKRMFINKENELYRAKFCSFDKKAVIEELEQKDKGTI